MDCVRESSELPATYVEGFHDIEAVRKMPYRKLGDTGLMVSVLGFGASALAGVFHSVTEEECIEVVRAAIKAGVNIIDTAPWYGNGKSEVMLGKALSGIPRKAYYLNSKVGRYEPDIRKRFDFSAERVSKSVDESLERLKLDYIDCIQVHDMEFAPDLDIICEQTLPALDRLRSANKVRMIGVTGYPLEQFRYVLQKCSVRIDTVLSYSRYTFVDRSLEDLLPFLEDRGVGLINAAPTGMGLLTAEGPPSWHPASAALRALAKRMAAACEAAGGGEASLATLALRQNLAHPRIPTTLISCARLPLMQANIKAATEPPTAAEARAMVAVAAEVAAAGGEGMHWEGVEVTKYWCALGPLLARQLLYQGAAGSSSSSSQN